MPSEALERHLWHYPGRRRCSGKILGEALQLTNILRDVAEDAKRDHVYLPDDLLVKNGYVSATPDFAIDDPAIARTCSELSEIAYQQFSAAQTVIRKLDLKNPSCTNYDGRL